VNHPQDPTDETRLENDETRLSGSSPSGHRPSTSTTPSSGWLSSSNDIDHGRFPPGTLFGGRYRIVGRLGRGGMGEVYRADDLKLGQPVALKFLSPELDRDAARLMQLHTEVRMARQVSHPNVCRVYDIDEVDGHAFLSMEYVDGEDLGSLLRRIGRFPVDRALELARQICAGLAAAHERGVIHRDLKPANVMLDGTGRVRITDFGLAGTSGETVRAGTPAYMAPEQLAGSEVTVRSDVYALGLVVYEVFTGRRAIDAKNVAELVRMRDEGAIAPPSEIVRDLDPAIDRAILRCLEREPAARPSSALAVAAALPGGDPLAAALAAGETPSPEMVAAAGKTEAVEPLPAIAMAVAALVGLAAFAVLSERALLTSNVPMERPPAVLIDRAREIARTLGYADPPADDIGGFMPASDYLRYARRHADGAATRERLRSGRPAGMFFWYRSSPAEMIPLGNDERPWPDNPPPTVPGMRSMTLDTAGRLMEFRAVPPQLEDAQPNAQPRANWSPLFGAAGLQESDFQPASPRWIPGSYSDERAAWEGPIPGWPDQRLRLEAAAYRGRIVFFRTINPWTQPASAGESTLSAAQQAIKSAIAAAVLLVLVGAVLVARHNLRKGRGDRRGAFRISLIVFTLSVLMWAIGASHASSVSRELGRLFTAIGDALFSSGVLWVLYMALEPYVRKFWPATVISWSRLLAGQVRDPLVGRDVLIGALAGIGMVLLDRIDPLLRSGLGLGIPPPQVPNVNVLDSTRRMIESSGQVLFNAGFNSLWIIFGMVAVNLIVRRVWITALVMIGFLMLTSADNIAEAPPVWFGTAMALIGTTMLVTVMLRFGLLTTVTFFAVNFLLASGVFTMDPAKWFFPGSTTLLLVVLAIALYGFYASRGSEPLFGKHLLD
jgi:serine/threonine-protein kinase